MSRNLNRRGILSEAQGGSETAIGIERDVSDESRIASLKNRNKQIFEIAIVEEVLSNPDKFFKKPWPEKERTFNGLPLTLGDVCSGRITSDDQGNFLSSPWNVENPELVDFLPPNSIKAFRKKAKNSGSGSKSILCFPFFSSHLSLPVKPGESVWIIKIENVYYWICRQPSYRQIEDVNFTFSQREINVRNVNESENELTYHHFDSASTKGRSINFADIITKSVSYKEEFTGEPVPRIAKDCGDFLIQGSNNSHIYLGKEKFQVNFSSNPLDFTGYSSIEETLPERRPISPAIDICVLRKKEEVLELKNKSLGNNESQTAAGGMGAVSPPHVDPKLRYFETEKAREKSNKEDFPEELIDNDILNCTARIYLSNASNIDDILLSPDYFREPDLSSSPGALTGAGDYGVMAAIGTNARLIGLETIKIQNVLGSSGIQFTPEGDVIIFGNSEGGAKIVLESGGDIRIVPGENGVLKLGSDTPEGVPIGGTKFELPNTAEGSIAYTPATTTSGGLIADPSDLDRSNPVAGLPKYSSKVLFS